MNYWLMKSEPEAFSIDDLKAKPESTEHWDGIRNYQARNFMRDDMEVGDKVLFYHSNCEEPGVVGIAEVASEAYPDHTAFDPAGKYYDPKSKEDSPRWVMVDVKFIEKFPKTVSLREIKTVSGLSDMRLVQKGNRLSIMPVEKSEFDTIVKMAGA
jgi:predicted RNA-binding protein with PUA-like domain